MLCIGAGGLGSPAALYLAAAGVGTLGLVDFDAVDMSNLQRQVLHSTADVGRSKLASARARIEADEPGRARRDARDDAELVECPRAHCGVYDVILDGTDNFPTRYLVNDACVLEGRPNVYGSIFRFEGQASVFGTKDARVIAAASSAAAARPGAELCGGGRSRRVTGACHRHHPGNRSH